jgi:uncharacterized phage infection (PIP) family protein YhgE
MKIKRFINNLFPREFFTELFGGLVPIGVFILFFNAILFALGMLADFFNWFPEVNNVMNKGASVFLAIFLAFVFCGWIYFGFYGFRKLTKYLIKTWKES